MSNSVLARSNLQLSSDAHVNVGTLTLSDDFLEIENTGHCKFKFIVNLELELVFPSYCLTHEKRHVPVGGAQLVFTSVSHEKWLAHQSCLLIFRVILNLD